MRRSASQLDERALDSPRTRGAGLSPSGTLSLLAIAAVLVVVSVPSLRGLAVQENEADARATAQLLARALRAAEEPGTPAPSLRAILREPELAGVLADAELLAKGSVLRRHGYLFEIVQFARGLEPGAVGGRLAIRAWPWDRGSTGEAGVLVTSAGACLVPPTPAPRWEGLESAGVALEQLAGWR